MEEKEAEGESTGNVVIDEVLVEILCEVEETGAKRGGGTEDGEVIG